MFITYLSTCLLALLSFGPFRLLFPCWYFTQTNYIKFLDPIIFVHTIWISQSYFRTGFKIIFSVLLNDHDSQHQKSRKFFPCFHVKHMMLSYVMLHLWFISTYMTNCHKISPTDIMMSQQKTYLANSRNQFLTLTDEC